MNENPKTMDLAEKDNKKSKTKKILNIVGTVFEVTLIVLVLLLTIVAIYSSKNKGYVSTPIGKNICLNVQSESMNPLFYKGDMVIAKEYDVWKKDNELVASKTDGTIVAYRGKINGKDAIKIHRIIEIKDGVITVEGDNEGGEAGTTREIIFESRIIGVYKNRLKGVGGAIDALKNKTVFFFVIILPLILLFGYNLFVFIRLLVKNQYQKKIALAEATGEIDEDIKQKAIAEYLEKMKQEKEKEKEKKEGDK